MGDTAMRLGTSMGPSLSGKKRCGTANTLWRMRREGEAVEIVRDPLLRNGPHAVQRALPPNWRATYARSDEQSRQRAVVCCAACHRLLPCQAKAANPWPQILGPWSEGS